LGTCMHTGLLSVFLSICLSFVLSGCLSACMRVLRMCECTDEWAPTHLLSSGSRGILVNIRFPDDTEKVLPPQTQIFFSYMLATCRSRSLTFSHPFSLLRSHSCTLSRIYVFVFVFFCLELQTVEGDAGSTLLETLEKADLSGEGEKI